MLQAARPRQQTFEFHAVQRARCGVEGAFAQTTRITSMRRARGVGQRKTYLQHLHTVLVTNMLRLVLWLEGAPFANSIEFT
jgi:Transposase DDE domain